MSNNDGDTHDASALPGGPGQPDPRRPAQFTIWDLLVWMTVCSCFFSTARLAGIIAVVLLPAFLIAPSVLAHPRNSPRVKLWFIVIGLIMSLALLRAG